LVCQDRRETEAFLDRWAKKVSKDRRVWSVFGAQLAQSARQGLKDNKATKEIRERVVWTVCLVYKGLRDLLAPSAKLDHQGQMVWMDYAD
jgi:hypothetical protein